MASNNPRLPLYTALMDARKEYLSKVICDDKGNYGKFISLVRMYDVLQPIFEKHGLLIIHAIRQQDEQRNLVTNIIHIETGEAIEDRRTLDSDKPGQQGLGAAESYQKRYALKSLLAFDDKETDDDGDAGDTYLNKGRPSYKREYSKAPAPAEDSDPFNDRGAKSDNSALKFLIETAKNGDFLKKCILESNRVESLDDLNEDQINGAMNFAKKNRK